MGEITTKIEGMIEKLQTTRLDAVKFEDKGNSSAGTRVRKAMQELRKEAQLIRAEVTEKKQQG